MGKIFISYAHEDENWKDRLKKHLAGLELDGLCDLWDDRRIETGQEWRKEIETALNSADIAVMLITADFLASNFIRSVELPRMLERRRNEGLKVFPVIVKPCSWKKIEWLSDLQAFPKDGEPLFKMSEPDIEDNLSKLADKVHDALQGCPAEEPKSVPAGKTILLTNPPKRKINFLGREQELKDIKTKLAKNERVLLVHGLGGIGKTEACKRFFMDHYCEYRYAGWIDYTGSLPASLVNACKPEVIGGREHDNIEQRFAAVMKYLHSIDRPALIVLDNIGNTVQRDPELELLFDLPAHIHVLATSRLSIDGFEMFPLDVLPEAACMTLFYNFYKGEQDDEAVKAVIGLCCRHTLTVELLARTAHTGKLPLKKLLAVLNEKGFNLSAAIPEKVGTFHWDEKGEKLFFDHLQTIFDLSGLDKKEENILANLSVLPALYTPTADIQEWLGLETKQEIAGLIDKGWLQQDKQFNIYMHPVIGEVVRQKTKPGSAACSKLIAALTGKLKVKPGDNPLAKQGYVLYADSLLRHIGEQTEALAALANNLSWIYQDMGQLNRALEFQSKALAIRKKVLAADHPDLAASYNNLALIYRAMGQLDRALEFQLKALAIREKVLAADHPALASSYNNLSSIYRDMGKLDRALDFQLKDLAITEKVLSADHPHLAFSYNNLSLIYQDMGRLDLSLEFQLKDLVISEKVLAADHPDLAISYNNLSLIYRDMGKLDRALEFQLKAMAIREKVLAHDHPDLAQSYNNLALIYQDMGKLGQALKYQLEALAIREKVLAADHPDLATSYNNLSLIYKEKCQLDPALKFQLKARAIREKLLSADHPALAQSYNNLSMIYRDMGQLDRAMEFQLKALAIREKVLAADHPDLAQSYNNLCTIYYNMGKLDTALPFAEKAVAIMEKLFPNGHPKMDKFKKNLARLKEKMR